MKSNTLASSAIALGLFAVAGSQVFTSISERQPTPVAAVQPVAAVERVAMQEPGEPFILWYDTMPGMINGQVFSVYLFRAWSDGTIEARNYDAEQYFSPSNGCSDDQPPVCSSPWFVISSPNEGRAAISDANADESVDLADLNLLLANFGPAPRNDIRESPCSFGLIPG
jgi:hypothetical protein